MPTYFFHVYNGFGESRDDDGTDCPDAEAARAIALAGIRGMLAEGVKAGELDLNGSVEVWDDAGRQIAVVQFRDAIRISPQDPRSAPDGDTHSWRKGVRPRSHP